MLNVGYKRTPESHDFSVTSIKAQVYVISFFTCTHTAIHVAFQSIDHLRNHVCSRKHRLSPASALFFSRSYKRCNCLCTHSLITHASVCQCTVVCCCCILRYFVVGPSFWFNFLLWNIGPGQCCHLVEQLISAKPKQCACVTCAYKLRTVTKMGWCVYRMHLLFWWFKFALCTLYTHPRVCIRTEVYFGL